MKIVANLLKIKISLVQVDFVQELVLMGISIQKNEKLKLEPELIKKQNVNVHFVARNLKILLLKQAISVYVKKIQIE